MTTVPDWPPLQEFAVSSDTLGVAFDYPAAYIPSVAWDQTDFEAGGDGHCMVFLVSREVVEWLEVARKSVATPIVPFARDFNGDTLYCFDATNELNIYAINLGEKTPNARLAGTKGYVDFLNAYRKNEGLLPWHP
jgi:hypothetical protein